MIQSFFSNPKIAIGDNLTNTAGLCCMFVGSRLKYNGLQVSMEDIA